MSPAAPRRARGRSDLGGDQVEGRRAVRELLVARRRRVHDVWISDTVDEESEPIQAIVEAAEAHGVPIRRVARGRLDAEASSSAPQGVLAHAAPLVEADFDQLLSTGRAGAPPFLLVLDGVTDPQNLGALLRTAEAAGVSGVVLPRHRTAHVTPTVAKAAAGAIEHVPLAVVPGVPSALQAMAAAKVWTVGLDADGSGSVFGLSVGTEPVALVLGAEGSGLGRLTRERCDLIVGIPHIGTLESLNVSVAGAVACFEVVRQRLG